jgi:hypothetical protein
VNAAFVDSAAADDLANMVATGLTYEQPGRWGGVRLGLVGALGYATLDFQLAPAFYDESSLPKGNFARTAEIHFGGLFKQDILPLGPLNVFPGLGLGISEVGAYDAETSMEEDIKSGFLQLELGVAPNIPRSPVQLVMVPYYGVCARPVHRANGSAGGRRGVDVHTVIAFRRIVNVFATFGWTSYSISEADTMTGSTDRLTGWSLLIGIGPSFAR